MSLRLYNTLTKKEEDFVPRNPSEVTMYTCGPTVYSRPHIGNYSSFLMADLLRRWLEVGHGCAVKHVKNITDVGHLLHDSDHGDDKIQKEAEKEQVHPLDIAKRYTEQYLKDEKALHILEPAERPRATEFIEHMTEMIEVLWKKGYAYVTSDGIYFDVTSKNLRTPYGTLSGNTLAAVKAGARVSIKEEKKHPSDFALWKFCVGDNAHHILRWPSPVPASSAATTPESSLRETPSTIALPDGFPGWHIECSAMSRTLLGDQIDIHTGGEDNIFPHHECEIAQSESVTEKNPFVRYWLHKRRIDMGGAKMSKSLGNVLSLDDILERGFDPMDLRYYLLSVHYRTNLKFSWKGMDDARKARRSIVEWMEEVGLPAGKAGTVGKVGKVSVGGEGEYVRRFQEAMDADLNTPAALAAVFDCMTWSRRPERTAEERNSLRKFCGMICATLGCVDMTEEEVPPDVQSLVKARAAARAAKDFAESDRLRRLVEKTGYEVRDTPDGQVIKRQ